MEPPNRFKFAQANSVILIDEFNSTYTDIHPFHALPPSLIARRAETLQSDPSTFTVEVKSGAIEIRGAHRKDSRAKDIAALMKRWTHLVDDINVTMSAHDGPSIMMDHVFRTKLNKAADEGVLLSNKTAHMTDDNAGSWGFSLACDPGSRLIRASNGLELNSLPSGPSFVADHVKTMDLCENPEWQYLHGALTPFWSLLHKH